MNQQLLTEEERALPQWQREARERMRMAEHYDMNSHPALWAKLLEIEAKLDKLLAARADAGELHK